MVSSTLENRDVGGPTNHVFMLMTSTYNEAVGSGEVMERTRQLFNTMNAEMPKGILEMSVGAGQEQEGDKSKYPMHFQGHH